MKVFSSKFGNSESSYSLIPIEFLGVVNKHAPLKKKILGGNHSPFVTKEFKKLSTKEAN